MPTITYKKTDNSVTISTDVEGASIYYTTDGEDPTTTNSTKPTLTEGAYTFTLGENDYVIKAAAAEDGRDLSEVAELTLQCATPIITPSGDNAQVTVSYPDDDRYADAANITIYYTTDGTDPGFDDSGNAKSSTQSPFALNSGVLSHTFTLDDVDFRAVAVKRGYKDQSEVALYEFEEQCEAPVLTYDEANKQVTIQVATGTTVYYTTGEADPSKTNGTAITTDETIDTPNPILVKAIAYKPGHLPSAIVRKMAGEQIFLIQSYANTAFYLIPNGTATDGKTTVKLNTLNIPSVLTAWLMHDVSGEAGYYYIQNKSTGDYLYYKEGFYMKTSTDFETTTEADKYKFQKVASTNGSYNIIPKGQTNGMNKSKGNTAEDAVGLYSTDDDNSRWNIIEHDSRPITPEITDGHVVLSTEDELHYYRIQNIQKSTFYIIPPATPARTNPAYPVGADVCLSISNIVYKDMIWAIELAEHDNYLNYYRFKNVVTGQYIYFQGTANGANAIERAVIMKTLGEEGAEADRYQFMIVRTADATNTDRYMIVPKPLKNTLANAAHSLLADNNDYGFPLKTDKNRNANTNRWKFVATTTTLPPTISIADGQVTLTAEDGATIHYTTNNTQATESSTPYSDPFSLGTANVIRAIAVKDGIASIENTFTVNYTNVFLGNPVNITTKTTDLNKDKNFYQMECGGNKGTNYYMIPAGNDAKNVTVKNAENLDGNDAAWYFRFAAYDNETRTRYFNVYNAVSGECLYYYADEGNVSAALVTKPINETGANAEKFKFMLHPFDYSTTETNPLFSIIPKNIRGLEYNCLHQSGGYTSGYFIKGNQRNNEYSIWKMWPVLIPETPVINTTSSDNLIHITAENATAIYYTIDGETNPTSSCTPYTEPFSVASGTTIKAIAYYEYRYGGIAEATYTASVTSAPVIMVTGNQVTITGEEGATIYYTTNGSDPTTSQSENFGTSPVTFTMSEGDSYTVKAIAQKDGLAASVVASKSVGNARKITNLTELQEMAEDGNYMLVADIDASSFESITSFSGTLEGGWDETEKRYYKISKLKHALFNTISGGIVKNLVFDDITISANTDGHAGAIANVATGTTRIYNCGVLATNSTKDDDGHIIISSSSVTGSGAVGGLVGKIETGSKVRVVNCYSFATINGGTHAGGIVGQNAGTVDAKKVENVRIANCVMYGDIKSGTAISPVYAGNHQSNVQDFTEYNYYLYSNRVDDNDIQIVKVPYTTYNDQQAITKEDYLTRFPFYRHILNTHRELASFFLFGDYESDHINEIGHWVLNAKIAPYPIIERWASNTKRTTEDIAANLPTTTDDYAGKKLTSMGTGGELNVTVKIGSKTYNNVMLPITDMDTLRYDYTWGKAVLPFVNEFDGWAKDYAEVCTGWKITSVDGETSFSAENYNFADRSNKQKDIYHETNNPYIFAQGGNYIVPEGVTSITIEANFAKAFYLSDEYHDFGYKTDYTKQMALGEKVPTTYHGKKVYTDLNSLLADMKTSKTPHSQAIVLVGNYHYNINTIGGIVFNNYTSRALTIMSVDEDCNQEPDYGWYTCMGGQSRPDVPALRFDFVPNIGIGMAAHVNGSSHYPNISIWKAHGWFELTETALSIMNQCEIDSRAFPAQTEDGNTNRWIANSGYFTQIVRSYNNPCDRLRYIQIGGNAYVKELYPGNHSTKNHTNPLIPINVTGGEIEECCMTGYHVGSKAKGSDIYFWCAGGKIHKFLGAYMETPVNSAGEEKDVNMTAKVDHALIKRFFGGGTSAKARISGDINVTINNSKVDFYCGGPEFGDMNSGKTVTTSATNTKFGKYYGAGFGGTSLTYVYQNENSGYDMNTDEKAYDRPFTNYTNERLIYNANGGIGTCYKFEFIPNSTGQKLVARIYIGRSQFSLATTGNVSNALTDCQIGNFYGAGCQGKVAGTVESVLNNCEVLHNAFGGGYKAESNELPVYPTTPPTYANYYRVTGVFSNFSKVDPETYHWEQGTTSKKNTADEESKTLYTDVATTLNMSELGNVTGAISLTINGGSVGENVFGGGHESRSLSNTTVILKGSAEVYGDVFGGGNKGEVGGSAMVNIEE